MFIDLTPGLWMSASELSGRRHSIYLYIYISLYIYIYIYIYIFFFEPGTFGDYSTEFLMCIANIKVQHDIWISII